MKKQMLFKTKGMNRDLSVSAFNSEFAFENMNLRLSTNDGNTMLSWVNEKGTSKFGLSITVIHSEYWSKDGESNRYTDPGDPSWTHHAANTDTEGTIKGYPIGTAVINHKLVLFTTTKHRELDIGTDYIYELTLGETENTFNGRQLFKGNLNFVQTYPLETLVSYEATDIQKVYWVDGRNQPRVINLEDKNLATEESSYFDFIRELSLNETVSVKKMIGSNGMFASGVIQYAFTYYVKHGQESNIFYTTPLYYISHQDRGASPEEKVFNNFRITVSHLDMRFDYLRIYSIQRTSINGTPICKRVRDIYLKDLDPQTEEINGESVTYYEAVYIDDGMSGNSIDPTELLYKGGKTIIAQTLEQKDNTLFLGNLNIGKYHITKQQKTDLVGGINLSNSTRRIYSSSPAPTTAYTYINQLTCFADTSFTNNVPCGGFKRGDYYRCGVQLQNKNGEWSEPIYVGNFKITLKPGKGSVSVGGTSFPFIELPTITGELGFQQAYRMRVLGYVKIRPVIVFPEIKDRVSLCQGILSPTLYVDVYGDLEDRQSSYFFRTERTPNTLTNFNDGSVAPCGLTSNHAGDIEYTPITLTDGDLEKMRAVEIEGSFTDRFKIDGDICTFHSPDVEFDPMMTGVDYSGSKYKIPGKTAITKTLADINIQTESPVLSDGATGFIHKTFVGEEMKGIVSGLFYEDFSVDDENNNFRTNPSQKSPFKWLVYPWQGSGSLNNDINRPADKGTPSSVLKKKVISNLRFADHVEWDDYSSGAVDYSTSSFGYAPQEFSSDEVTIVKVGDIHYKGNVDTMLSPYYSQGKFFAFAGTVEDSDPPYKGDMRGDTPFTSTAWWKTYSKSSSSAVEEGLYQYDSTIVQPDADKWVLKNDRPGENYIDLVMKKAGVRMKYKSTPHLVLKFNGFGVSGWSDTQIPVLEVVREETTNFVNNLFGGDSIEALKENKWIPCGEPVRLDKLVNVGTEQNPVMKVQFKYSYGDTYYQRYDCLKTYPFTREDVNQIVEIGSFMLETRVNIDGRYDRNRGQLNNLNMTPQNFNLMNAAYSQTDNFFTYKITEGNEESVSKYPNQITWSKTKESGADVDLWTNLTLASVLELDGDRGEITSLQRLNNNLIAFQDTGISRIMYNDNVQIQSTEGVPIEIANSGKVQGKDYLSDTVGCSNKWSIVSTPSGLYFADSKNKNLYLFNGQLVNVSDKFGMSSWVKHSFFEGKSWIPSFGNSKEIVSYYDKGNQDVLFINGTSCLAFSEKLGTFTSFYSYNNTPYFVNLEGVGVWVRNPYTVSSEVQPRPAALWKHQGGDYCSFFGDNKPYWMTLVGNSEPQMDKIFTNLEFRACVDGDGTPSLEVDADGNPVKVTPDLPFDFLEAWNEYQHGYTTLENKNGHSLSKHGGDSSALLRKFRIWRSDIPRNNCILDTPSRPSTPYSSDAELGISRHIRKPQDRMRNTWIYLKMMKDIEYYTDAEVEAHNSPITGTVKAGDVIPDSNPEILYTKQTANAVNAEIEEAWLYDEQEKPLSKTEIHDVVMTYFT